MPTLSLRYDGDVATKQLQDNMSRAAIRVRKTMQAIAEDAARQIVNRGQQDIRLAGAYAGEWLEGLTAKVLPYGDGEISIEVRHTLPQFMFLNRGGTIEGHPLLWVPTREGEAYDMRQQGTLMGPGDYPGNLVPVTSKAGVPLLIDPDLSDHSQTAVEFVGFPSITIQRKFHTLDIIRQVAKELKASYDIRYKTSA